MRKIELVSRRSGPIRSSTASRRRGFAAQVVYPVEQQVGLDVERPRDGFRPGALERFHPGPERVALLLTEHVDTGEEAVLAKGIDLGPGQPLAHLLALVRRLDHRSRHPVA